MAKKRVTQADVAQRAGVSQTAVSQILSETENGVSNFRPETRQLVLQAAAELGYVPSVMARALRTNQTMAIGVVVGFLTDELSLRITRGIHDVATERGYKLLIGATEQNPELEKRTLDQFHQYQVDGLIFVDSWSDPATYLNDDIFPPMVFGQLRSPMIEHNCVGVDNVRGGYEATRHLLDLGYRTVAHISGPKSWASAVDRRIGYEKALGDYDLACDLSLIETGDWEVRTGNQATHRLLDRNPEIDAIFAGNDLMAAGCIQAAINRGLRVPQDLAVVGYDDRHLAEALSPPLTSFAYPLNQIGQKTAHLLIERLLRRKTHLVPSMNVAGRMVVRASCGAVNPE